MIRRVRLLAALMLLLLGVTTAPMPGRTGEPAATLPDAQLLLSAAGEGDEAASEGAPASTRPASASPIPASAPAAEPAIPGTMPATPALPTSMASGGNLAIIRIDRIIDETSYDNTRLMTERAVQGGATIIVYEIQTPGGSLTSALKISKEIKAANVTKIAWINRDAYSAGAIIATACDRIVIAPSGAIGDAAPILPGRSLSPTERSKVVSPVLAELRDNARRNGYDYAVLEAMATLGAEVYLIEEIGTGRRRCVNQADYRVMVQGEAINAVQGVGAAAPGLLSPPPPPPPAAAPGGPGVPGLSSGETVVNPGQLDLATEADRGRWKLVRQVHNGRSLLTLNQTEAQEVGLARKVIKDETELTQYLQAKIVARVEPGALDVAARVLSLMPVRMVLMILLLGGIYFELQAPGTGIGAAVALISLIILIVAPLVAGLAQAWHIGLFLIGLVLLVLEMVPPPTFGLLAVLGLVMMFVGLTLSVVPASGSGPFNLPADDSWNRLQQSILWTLIAFIVSVVGIVVAMRHFGSLPILNAMVHKETGAMLHGPESAPVSGDEAMGAGRIAVGDAGIVVSELRPIGRARVNDQVIDVMTMGSWLPQGASVRVVEVAGNRIVVEQA